MHDIGGCGCMVCQAQRTSRALMATKETEPPTTLDYREEVPKIPKAKPLPIIFSGASALRLLVARQVREKARCCRIVAKSMRNACTGRMQVSDAAVDLEHAAEHLEDLATLYESSQDLDLSCLKKRT